MPEYIFLTGGIPYPDLNDPNTIWNDGDPRHAWACLCGNEPHLDGFFPVAEDRGFGDRLMGYHMSTDFTPYGPGEERWTDLYACGQCHRVIDQTDGKVVGVISDRDFRFPDEW